MGLRLDHQDPGARPGLSNLQCQRERRRPPPTIATSCSAAGPSGCDRRDLMRRASVARASSLSCDTCVRTSTLHLLNRAEFPGNLTGTHIRADAAGSPATTLRFRTARTGFEGPQSANRAASGGRHGERDYRFLTSWRLSGHHGAATVPVEADPPDLGTTRGGRSQRQRR